jgi:beta-glucanase (GH16 family)
MIGMTHRGVIAALSFVLLAALMPLASAGGASSPGTCGGVTMQKPGGGTWTCTFDDEFNGTSLDTTKWVVQLTSNSGYTTGLGSGTACYVNNPDTVSESGGYLHLGVRRTKPVACHGSVFSPVTSYEAGMVSTYHLFSQAYGLFEASAMIPAAQVPGLQETLWLWPVNDTKYGKEPASGEIDYAEFYSQYPALDVPYIHYNAKGGTDPNRTSYTCKINEGQFNTYGVQWTPTALTILLNGNVCLVDNWNPAAPPVKPAPFNQPFFLALTKTPLPATTLIDWIRVWK